MLVDKNRIFIYKLLNHKSNRSSNKQNRIITKKYFSNRLNCIFELPINF
jgi:hypothetical protein